MRNMFSFLRLAFRGLCFHWRVHLSVALGTAVAGTALIGAMLAGDSVRFSLRRFALQRLGNVNMVMNTNGRFYREELADAVAARLSQPVASALRLDGIAVVQQRDTGDRMQVNRVQVLGVDTNFWRLSPNGGPIMGTGEIALSRKLAKALDARVGSEVGLRVGQPSLMPRDAPLASRSEKLSRYATLKVISIVEDNQLGRFDVAANQIAPYNAFVDLDWLQHQVDLAGRANMMLVGYNGEDRDQSCICPIKAAAALEESWQLSHVGIELNSYPDLGITQLESDRIFLDPETTRAATGPAAAATPGTGILTYMVNRIATGTGKSSPHTPYSFMVAASPDDTSPVPAGLKDDQIVINRWLADALTVTTGAELRVSYYKIGVHGDFTETNRTFTVHSIVEMEAITAERELMPHFPGLTDVESCRDWDVGLPMKDAELRDPANEAYWDRYGATPKAFVTLAAGQQMWANRFGNLSSVRYAVNSEAERTRLRRSLRESISPRALGLFLLPIRQQALKALADSLDLGEYFLYMSFFLIVAALLLTGLLFTFGVQRRATELGTLMAIGYQPAQVRLIVMIEGVVVAFVGSIGGLLGGAGYTKLLIWGLSTRWSAAIANASITYHATPEKMIAGAIGSILCGLIPMGVAAWSFSRRPARDLLTHDFTGSGTLDRCCEGKPVVLTSLTATAAVVAACLVGWVVNSNMHNMVPVFFTAGFLLLMAGLGGVGLLLRYLGLAAGTRVTLATMGIRNTARRRGRSLVAVGLLACGSFIVFAVSAMQEDLAAHAHERWSGTGGFDLFAESTLAMPNPLETERGQTAFNLQTDPLTAKLDMISMRVRDGDDASCFNLNRAQAPRLIGVDPAAFIKREAFAETVSVKELWGRLNAQLPGGVVPGLVGDSDTLMWNLKKIADPDTGNVIRYKDENGADLKVRLVGKLPMRLSVFTGTILISADNFVSRYPSEAGYRMALIGAPAGRVGDARSLLTTRLARVGLDVTTCLERQEAYYSVERTYLGMFLVLGGLGLLLGAVGMGIVVLRNALERRPELAVLRCMGYSQRNLSALVVAEHWTLLLAGVAIGVIAASVAVWPNLAAPGVSVPYGLVATLLVSLIVGGLSWIAITSRLSLRGSIMDALRGE